MKKVKYLLLVFVAMIILTGCSTNSKNESSSVKEDKKTEEKTNKNDNKKNNNKKEDNKKDDDKKNDSKKDDDKKNNTNGGLTSNSDETLVCSLDYEGQTFEMTVGWKNDKINLMGVEMAMDLTSYGIDESTFDLYSDIMVQSLEEAYGITEDTEGVEMKIDTDKAKNTINIKIVIDLEKADSELISKLNINLTEDDLNHSYEEFKNEAIAAGYNCK